MFSAVAFFLQQNYQNTNWEIKRWNPYSKGLGSLINCKLSGALSGAGFLLLKEMKGLQLHVLPSSI